MAEVIPGQQNGLTPDFIGELHFHYPLIDKNCFSTRDCNFWVPGHMEENIVLRCI